VDGARVVQSQDERAVALPGRAAHRETATVVGLRLVAELAGFAQRFNLLLGERLDRRLFEAWGRNGLHGIGDTDFSAGPGDEGGQGMVAARHAARLVVGAQPGEVAPQVLRRHAADVHVADLGEPRVEVVLVAFSVRGLRASAALRCRKPWMASTSFRPGGLRFIEKPFCFGVFRTDHHRANENTVAGWSTVSSSSGEWIRTCDLRVMSS